jgi:hypothetical protein
LKQVNIENIQLEKLLEDQITGNKRGNKNRIQDKLKLIGKLFLFGFHLTNLGKTKVSNIPNKIN